MRPVARTFAVGLALACAAAVAQESGEPAEEPRDQPIGQQPELSGVVTTHVSTNLGHLFASRFTEAWSRQSQRENHQLEVRERLSARYGTDVLVRNSDDVLVFRAVLPRQPAAVAALAEAAAETVNERLADLALQQLLFQDIDMARPGL